MNSSRCLPRSLPPAVAQLRLVRPMRSLFPAAVAVSLVLWSSSAKEPAVVSLSSEPTGLTVRSKSGRKIVRHRHLSRRRCCCSSVKTVPRPQNTSTQTPSRRSSTVWSPRDSTTSRKTHLTPNSTHRDEQATGAGYSSPTAQFGLSKFVTLV